MSTTIELWFWEIRNQSTGPWRKINNRMTDGDARKRFGADAPRMDGTLEVRHAGPVADDHHACGLDAGDAAHENARAAVCFLQEMGSCLDGHASGHRRHRREQRQAAVARGGGFIGDAARAAFAKLARLLRIGREVQVGEKQLPEPTPLACLRAP